MHMFHDPDDFVAKSEHHPCHCELNRTKCNGCCTGSSGYWLERRPQAEIDKIKADKRRQEEDEILMKARIIEARRGIR